MNALLLLSCLAALQLPNAQEPAPSPGRLDVIVLDNGERFEGRITAETDGYIRIQLDQGAELGLRTFRVKSILRGAGAEVGAHAARLAPRDEWFALHDAAGKAVGWLHATVTVDGAGAITVNEEYEFAQGPHRIQVTSLCVADAELTPVRCYFRERRVEPVLPITVMPGVSTVGQPDRVVDERIVEARCQGDRLVVTHAAGGERSERVYAWSPGATFPMLARIAAGATGEPVEECEMFDPATEELAIRSVASPRHRAVAVAGRRMAITEIVETGAHLRNATWLDASASTLRREIAGPALVAVPTAARDVRQEVGRAPIPAALAREAEGAFGLWVPNPAWQVVEGLPAGQVVLTCEAHGATIGLTRIDHLGSDIAVDVAVDAVANWTRLLHPGLEVERRETVKVRESRAVRLVATGRQGRVPTRATVDVIPYGGRFYVLTCRAPAGAWSELAADFATVLRSLELAPESVDPPLQGPLRAREPARRNVRIPKAQQRAGSAPESAQRSRLEHFGLIDGVAVVEIGHGARDAQ